MPKINVNKHPNLDKIFSQNNSLNQLKNIIADKNQALEQEFNPHNSVDLLLKDKTAFIDTILIVCWKHFVKSYADKLCLIASGSYGRCELFPHSDIDILILLNHSNTSKYQTELTDFSNFLWDLGFKPGQSVRTISECISLAAKDQTIMTNLLEIRLITGNQDLFVKLKKQILEKKYYSSNQFFAAKMQEQEQRHNKYHDTAYNLEPNIKECPGGLRDLQTIVWVFKYHYQSKNTIIKLDTLKQLIEAKYLSPTEYAELIAAKDTLWCIRFALHILTKRCEDRLLFDYQQYLATQFGYLKKTNNANVEQFMQHYFKTVMQLERINQILLQIFNENFFTDANIKPPQQINKNFIAINNYIEVKDVDTFKKNPLALLEIFLLLQQNNHLKGIRSRTIKLIKTNLFLIDDAFRHNNQANQLFLSILKSPHGLTHQLRQMNRYGILAAYLPSFANIVARMQYDLFHIYTVDEHTLFVLRNLRRLALPKHNKELPFCNQVFLSIAKVEILYIAALFHDIAKGKAGDHSVLGEQIAKQFCLQHKLSKHDTNLVTWLVRNHLIMSMTAQRKDINDPAVIHKFSLQIGSIKYLNHLYLLTVADIMATNPKLWNSWKDSLLLELYTATHSTLLRGLQNPLAKSEYLTQNKQEAKLELISLGISESAIRQTWAQISDDYFLRYSAEEIVWHTIAIASTNKNSLPLVLLRPQNKRASVEIFVYTKNKKAIFSLSVATLDNLGLTILDARITTTTLAKRQQQYVLNSFQVLEQSGEPIRSLDRELQICQTLQNNLINSNVKILHNIRRQSRQAKHFPIISKIYFHQDPLNLYTVIELITTDHAGLLATVGKVFSQLDIKLHDAKITTIGSRVEDMFYVTDSRLKPITDTNKLQDLSKKLISILASK